MLVTQSQKLNKFAILSTIKSFLIWAILLEVCFLVVGFPLVTLIIATAAIVAIALQSVMTASAVLWVVSIVIGANLLAVLLTAASLSLKGIHPHEVSWLGWLTQDDADQLIPRYPACPLTCALTPVRVNA
ncbi:MAG: hypothetical protein AAF215_10135 [Cyanobacteria bacterium P01_A01_bin.123]